MSSCSSSSMDNGKKQRRSLKPRALPKVIPPKTMSRARVRPSREKETAPNPLAETAWDHMVAELSVILAQPDIWKEEPEEKLDPQAAKEREEKDAARARMWDCVVAMVIDEMREPERRDWLHQQRMEDERQRNMKLACADWSGPAQYVEF
ncbi:hypothetical protein C8R45DRAFT_1089409 [Mycena sanguinolenta]|nr:hypothetical protein C8R45DRAFT_1113402 [Mycena sanguinolenta]KAJ6484088.1 hypothetical protein C8R45DRAFT_931538 [Mycena sanguinolenta]KAJ6508206.1 hypothetical protein C8R45DRAFT_1089409 [Mycena sanguinolenta]